MGGSWTDQRQPSPLVAWNHTICNFRRYSSIVGLVTVGNHILHCSSAVMTVVITVLREQLYLFLLINNNCIRYGMQEVHTPSQGRPSTSGGDPGRRFSQLQRQQSTASQRSLRPQPSLRRSLSNRATAPVPSGQAPAKVGPAGRHEVTALCDYVTLLWHILWTQESLEGVLVKSALHHNALWASLGQGPEINMTSIIIPIIITITTQ